MIQFNEEKHQYTNNAGVIYTSATQFISKFHMDFEEEEDFWLLIKAIQYLSKIDKPNKIRKYSEELDHKIGKSFFSKDRYRLLFSVAFNEYYAKNVSKIIPDLDLSYPEEVGLSRAIGLVKEYWINENKKSTIKGTAFHNWQEDLQFSTGVYNYKGIDYAVVTRKLGTLLELEEGVHPEVRLWNDKYRLAGTSDQVIVLKNREVIIRDWKGLALDTPITTPTGWSMIGDLKIGDRIYDGNGVVTKVKNVSEIHYNPCYKITFDTNETIIADHEHKWEVEHKKGSLYTKTLLNTEELFGVYPLVRINLVNLEFSKKDLPIDPYVLGLWLADGNSTTNTITCLNKNIWKEIKNRGYLISDDHNKNNEKAESRTVFKIRKKLIQLNLLNNKHIPDIYLRSSTEQRLDLLRGFMDGDGYFHRSRKRCSMQTTKEWQAEALITLLASLGVKATKFYTKGRGFGKSFNKIDVCFSPNFNPFLIRNNDYLSICSDKKSTKNKYRYIKKIELVDTVPTKCLEVESDTHTFLAGKGFIKTHNTNKKLDFYNEYGNHMYEPISHLHDCNMVHYNLQLSLYGWMLEQFGYKVVGLEIVHYELEEQEKNKFIIQSAVPYQLKYLKEDIENMLEYDLQKTIRI